MVKKCSNEISKRKKSEIVYVFSSIMMWERRKGSAAGGVPKTCTRVFTRILQIWWHYDDKEAEEKEEEEDKHVNVRIQQILQVCWHDDDDDDEEDDNDDDNDDDDVDDDDDDAEEEA